MNDNEQPAAPATGNPHDETREHRKPGAEPALVAKGNTPEELIADVQRMLGVAHVVTGTSWHELIYNASLRAPQGDLAKPIVARLSNAAAVARQAGF